MKRLSLMLVWSVFVIWAKVNRDCCSFFFDCTRQVTSTFRCASACLLRENIRSSLRRRRAQINASHPYYSRVCRMGFSLPTLQQCRNRKVYNNIVTSQHLHATHKSSSILFSFALFLSEWRSDRVVQNLISRANTWNDTLSRIEK